MLCHAANCYKLLSKFQEQEQRVKYDKGIDQGRIHRLDPRQGQGAQLVRQYLEKIGEDPVFLFYYFLPNQYKIDHPLHSRTLS